MALRIFISHASPDAAFAEQLAADLRRAGADVWLDATHIGPGDFVDRINQAINARDVLVLVLTPDALTSQWVPAEMNAAIVRSKQGFMQSPVVVLAKPVPLRDIPGLWTTYNRVDATTSYDQAFAHVARALGLVLPVDIPASVPADETFTPNTISESITAPTPNASRVPGGTTLTVSAQEVEHSPQIVPQDQLTNLKAGMQPARADTNQRLSQPQRRRGFRRVPVSIIGGVLVVALLVCGISGFLLYPQISGAASLAAATATVSPTQSRVTTVPGETVIYRASLTDNPQDWPEDRICFGKSNGYHVMGGHICFANSNATYMSADVYVTATPLKTGQSTYYGIVFRLVSKGNYYAFEITSTGQWGVIRATNGDGVPISPFTNSSAIRVGNYSSNYLQVLAVGSHFTFFINNQQVGSTDDSTFSDGYIGVLNDDTNASSEVAFSDFVIAEPNP